MKTQCLHPTRSHSAAAANALLGVVFAAGLTVITIAPAVADDNSQHAQRHDEQRGEHQQNHRKQRPTQHRYDERYQSRGYSNPAYVYAPPPVVYDPRPSPGVSLFFSL
jgi:hypothetical protein